ncbi:hypothetical protein J6590_024286 [Homalodisca vitripennis]|nr:hypothetical protein J6590_024286 [Homalodisca vitripennis]
MRGASDKVLVKIVHTKLVFHRSSATIQCELRKAAAIQCHTHGFVTVVDHQSEIQSDVFAFYGLTLLRTRLFKHTCTSCDFGDHTLKCI